MRILCLASLFALLSSCTIAEPSLIVECAGSNAFTSTSNLTISFSSALLHSTDLACDALDVSQPVRMIYFIPQVSGMWSFMVDNNNNSEAADLVMEIRLACSNQVLGCNDDLEYNSIQKTGLLQVELRSHVEYAILLGTWRIPTQLEQYALQVSYDVDENPTTDFTLVVIIAGVAFVVCCIVVAATVQQKRSRAGGEIEQAMIPAAAVRSPKDLEANPVFFAERRQHHIRAVSPKAAISPRIV